MAGSQRQRRHETQQEEDACRVHGETMTGGTDKTGRKEHDGNMRRRLVDLSHPITHGMVTLPGLPGPEISIHMSREQSQANYAPGTTFEIGRITMVANTGTYLDSPNHRFADGVDLAGLALDGLVDLPCAVILCGAAVGQRAIDVPVLEGHDVEGKAVLLHTGDSTRFGTPEYVVEASYLTRAGAEWLAREGATLVGIDAANIDDMADPERPAHTTLLREGIPIVEHLADLGRVTVEGARFTAVPPKIVGFGTFPVRAFASLPI
jgi:kynurenine formamidase